MNKADADNWISAHLQQLPQEGLALDLACGKGRHTRLLLDHGLAVLAADITPDVDVAAAARNGQALETLQYDFEAEPWPFPAEFFDVILVCNYLHRPLFEHMRDSLKPGGKLIYTTFMQGNEQYGRPRNPDFLLKSGELQDIFNDGFIIEAAEESDNGRSVRQSLLATKAPDRSPD